MTLTVADMPVRTGQDGLVGSCGGLRADRPKRRKFTAAIFKGGIPNDGHKMSAGLVSGLSTYAVSTRAPVGAGWSGSGGVLPVVGGGNGTQPGVMLPNRLTVSINHQ